MNRKTRHRKVVTGIYSDWGYAVYVNHRQVYAAGNNPHDSGAAAAPGHALPVTTLAKYCKRSAREIAAENNAVFGGIEAEDAA